MSSRRNLKLALLAAGAVTLLGRSSYGYNSGTHHGIAAYSWQVMRAASDPQFGNHIAWRNNVVPAPLTQAGTCDLCGPSGSQANWTTFLAKVPNALGRLNTLNPGLSFIPCQDKLSSDNTLKGMQFGLGTTPSAIDSR